MQEFKFDKQYIPLMKSCLAVVIGLLALSFTLPFFLDQDPSIPYRTIMVTVICIFVFGGMSIITWLTLKKLPFVDVAADDDGIWYIHIGKQKGLISWGVIHKLKERPYLQRLDLLDRNNKELLRIEYQLLGFERLRNVLNERACTLNLEPHQSMFSKGPLHHLSYVTCIVGLPALGIYLGGNGNILLGYGGMSLSVIVILYEYLLMVTGIQITNDSLLISYPLTKRNILFADIKDVTIYDEFNREHLIPQVWVVTTHTKKPFKLKKLGADPNVIYRALKKAVDSSTKAL